MGVLEISDDEDADARCPPAKKHLKKHLGVLDISDDEDADVHCPPAKIHLKKHLGVIDLSDDDDHAQRQRKNPRFLGFVDLTL